MSIVIGLIAGIGPVVGNMYHDYRLLPVVSVTPNDQCVKVTNYENGHAFTCPDVDVLLRRYKKVIVSAS
jgi:hypothetical protein